MFELLGDDDFQGEEDDPVRVARLTLVASGALGLRKAIRDKHKDVRMNSRCIQTAWEYIEEYEADFPLRAAATNGRKRRRNDERDDNDYRPSPISQLGPAVKTRGRPKKS